MGGEDDEGQTAVFFQHPARPSEQGVLILKVEQLQGKTEKEGVAGTRLQGQLQPAAAQEGNGGSPAFSELLLALSDHPGRKIDAYDMPCLAGGGGQFQQGLPRAAADLQKTLAGLGV